MNSRELKVMSLGIADSKLATTNSESGGIFGIKAQPPVSSIQLTKRNF